MLYVGKNEILNTNSCFSKELKHFFLSCSCEKWKNGFKIM